MDSKILSVLTGTTLSSISNITDLKSSKPSTYTALISGAKTVNCIFPGKVIFLGYYKDTGSVYVAVSNHELVRYLNLKDITVKVGDQLSKGDLIGNVQVHKGLQFEYCTQWKSDSVYPVRFNNNLYFKQNPLDLLIGNYEPTNQTDIINGISRPNDTITFTEDQLKEWGPTLIDNTDVYIEGAVLN